MHYKSTIQEDSCSFDLFGKKKKTYLYRIHLSLLLWLGVT